MGTRTRITSLGTRPLARLIPPKSTRRISLPASTEPKRDKPEMPKREETTDIDRALKSAKRTFDRYKTSTAPPLSRDDVRLASFRNARSAVPAQDLQPAVPPPSGSKILTETNPTPDIGTEAKAVAPTPWTDAQQAEADRRAAQVAATGLVEAIDKVATGEKSIFIHLNTLSNPALKSYVGDEFRKAYELKRPNVVAIHRVSAIMGFVSKNIDTFEGPKKREFGRCISHGGAFCRKI